MRDWSRKADSDLHFFVDALREALDLEPLYQKKVRLESERFYVSPPRPFTRATARSVVT